MVYENNTVYVHLRKHEEPQGESTTSTIAYEQSHHLRLRCKTIQGKPLKLKKTEVHFSKRREKLTSFWEEAVTS